MLQKQPVALLIEDEPLIAIDVEDELVSGGFAVFIAPSCKDAEQWLKTLIPDVVIVDIALRDGMPLEIIAAMNAANIPFIVHSADHPSVHENTLFSKGVWVTKPAAHLMLLQTANHLLAG